MSVSLNLKPFVPERDLRSVQWNADDVDVDVEDMYGEYGFLPSSMQHNFFKSGTDEGRVVLMMYTENDAAAPRHLADDRVVARLFGTFDKRKKKLTIWHVSVRRQHPYNNSMQGQRWGFGNLSVNPKVKQFRWIDTATGKGITRKTASRFIQGTPNPYAAEVIVLAGTSLQCEYMEQHPLMPCAQLFSSMYGHKSHPSIFLLYHSLGFVGNEHLTWDKRISPPLNDSYNNILTALTYGIPFVSHPT